MQREIKIEDEPFDYAYDSEDDYGDGEIRVAPEATHSPLSDLEYERRYERAKKRVDEIRDLYIHAGVYVCINAFLWLFDLVTGSGLDFAYFVTLLWGIGLVIHFGSVFGESIFLGHDWEERKIRQLMGEDEKPKRRN